MRNPKVPKLLCITQEATEYKHMLLWYSLDDIISFFTLPDYYSNLRSTIRGYCASHIRKFWRPKIPRALSETEPLPKYKKKFEEMLPRLQVQITLDSL